MRDDRHLHLRHDRAHRRHGRRRALAPIALAACVAAAAAAVALGAHGGTAKHHTPSSATAAASHASHPAPPRPDPTVAAVDRVIRQTSIVRVGGGAHRYIALTFDDGPSPYTVELLNVLRARHVPATFFEVGRMLPVFGSGARAVHRAGFPIGDHTQDHPPLAALGASAQLGEIVEPITRLEKLGNPRPQLFRPPYMSYNAATVALMRRLHMLMILWTIDSQDYRLPGVSAIVYRVLSGARPGAIVLMHDGGGVRSETVAAVPLIVDALRRRGYQFVTVPELMLKDPPASAAPPPAARRSTAGSSQPTRWDAAPYGE